MTKLKFEDPPPAKRAPRRFDLVAQELKANPGRWAVIAVFDKRPNANSTARQIRLGLTSYWQNPGDFEAVSRAVGDEFRVYARYLGEGKGESSE
jgi:hypothetical protein